MMKAGADVLAAWLTATWPAEATERLERLTLQRSAGGGRRVQAGRLGGEVPPAPAVLAEAAARMQGWGQRPLYMVAHGQGEFDTMLGRAGYRPEAETVAMVGPLATMLAVETPRLSTFALWPPLAIMAEFWTAEGIGPDRQAVMARVAGARTALMAREGDRPGGAAFVARCGTTAIVHALVVRTPLRRRGIASRLMGAAAQWAEAEGCLRMAVLVEAENAAARALYAALGMHVCGGYHYRVLEEPAT